MPGEDLDRLTDAEIMKRLRVNAQDHNSARYSALRAASVLIPLLRREDAWHVLYTRRTETLTSHKGQVSFPGGAADPGDPSPEMTALREAYEEIGLKGEDVKLLGTLDRRPTISQFLVTPVVARIPWPYPFQLSSSEVSRVFTIPIAWLADPGHREERPHNVPGGYYEKVIYYQPYDGEILWGATARITVDLLEVLS